MLPCSCQNNIKHQNIITSWIIKNMEHKWEARELLFIWCLWGTGSSCSSSSWLWPQSCRWPRGTTQDKMSITHTHNPVSLSPPHWPLWGFRQACRDCCQTFRRLQTCFRTSMRSRILESGRRKFVWCVFKGYWLTSETMRCFRYALREALRGFRQALRGLWQGLRDLGQPMISY